MGCEKDSNLDPIYLELQKKGYPVEETVNASKHSGKAFVTNNWGGTISELTLRHRRSNSSSKQEQRTWNMLAPGATAQPPLDFTYETGAASDFDYWWVKFTTVSGDTYTCKSNFYCSVSSGDDGNVEISLNGDDDTMTLEFSSSSGCWVSLSKK